MACTNFEIGNKVRIVRTRLDHKAKHLGEVFTIGAINPNGNVYCETHYAVVENDKCIYVWFNDELELVEDKKVFTKSDLKTGMFGVMSNGQGNFVVVNDTIVYQNGGYDCIHEMNDDMEFACWKIEKVYDNCPSFDALYARIKHERTDYLVYDRERDTKPLYNGKVVCIDNAPGNGKHYTVGKIYQFKDGLLTADDNIIFPNKFEPVHNFKEWSEWSTSKFIEVVE